MCEGGACLCGISTRVAGELEWLVLVSVLIIFGLCGSENGASRKVTGKKLADAAVFKNWFVCCRKVEGRCAGCCILIGFGWSPVNGRVKGTVEPCYVRVFQPANRTSKSRNCGYMLRYKPI